MKKSLRLLDILFKRSVRFGFKYPRALVFLSTALFIFCGVLSSRLTQVVSIEDQLDSSMESTRDLKQIKSLFGSETNLGFILEPKTEFFSLTDLCLIQKEVNDIVFSHPQVDGFMSPYKIRKAVSDADTISYFRVLPSPCEGSFEGNPLGALTNSPWATVVTDRTARDFAVSLRMKDLEVPGKFGTYDPDAVEELLKVIQEKIPFKIWWTGTSAQQLFTMKGMAQSQYINLAVILIIGLSMRLLFGTWRGGAIFLLTLFFTSSIVYGGMALVGHPVDPLSVCLFLMIAVASIEDFVFLSYYKMGRNIPWRKAFYRMTMPCFFTSLTTMLGFGSLVVSDLESIRRFGAWAAFGCFVEWISVFVLIPAFMQVFPSWQNYIRKDKAWFYKVSTEASKWSPPKRLAQISLLVFVLAFFSVKNFRLSQTPSEMFPKDHPFQQAIEYIKETRGWVADASLVFEKHVSEDQKKTIIAELRKDPLIVKVETYEQLVSYVSSDIGRPLEKEMIAREVDISTLSDRYKADDGEERAILYLQTTNTEKLNIFREKVKSICPNKECWLAGEFVGFADFSKSLIETLFESLFLSLFLVGGIIFYLSRATGKKYFLPIMASAFWGPSIMLCGIYVFDLSINFVTCIVASTLVGLTGDNAIQYLFGGNDLDEGIEDRGVGSIQCASVMFICCLSFLGSYFEPPRALGLLLAAGFLFSLVGDLWVLKALIKKGSA
ncbi:MMPL family transporter [Bdellovibrio sp. HCB337]|uniref:MMPL family transporter n=1 Tax=Bdellovibrio sp. HCB337 TaxID=3394358 RepID=UPI0039A63720